MSEAVAGYDLDTLGRVLRESVPEFTPLAAYKPRAATVVASRRGERRNDTHPQGRISRRRIRTRFCGQKSIPRKCCRSSISATSKRSTSVDAGCDLVSKPTATRPRWPTLRQGLRDRAEARRRARDELLEVVAKCFAGRARCLLTQESLGLGHAVCARAGVGNEPFAVIFPMTYWNKGPARCGRGRRGRVHACQRDRDTTVPLEQVSSYGIVPPRIQRPRGESLRWSKAGASRCPSTAVSGAKCSRRGSSTAEDTRPGAGARSSHRRDLGTAGEAPCSHTGSMARVSTAVSISPLEAKIRTHWNRELSGRPGLHARGPDELGVVDS